MKDGLYFGMPEDDYHALKRVSSTLVKHLHVSDLDGWANSFLNPHKDEDESESDSQPKIFGAANHKRILEGLKAFDKCYAEEFEGEEGMIKSTADISAVLKELKAENPEVLVSFKNKEEGVARLLTYNIDEARIFDLAKAKYEAENEGKIFMAKKYMRRIAFAASIIETSPALSENFKNGYAEVTVLWTDPATGIPMKSRLDFMKPRQITDLKTFANQQAKQSRAAIAGAIANYKYHVQIAVYKEAFNRAVEFIASGNVFALPGAKLPPKKWLDSVEKDPQFVFVFQQTGLAPYAKMIPIASDMVLVQEGEKIMTACLDRFRDAYTRFKEAPWHDPDDVVLQLDDADFPMWLFK